MLKKKYRNIIINEEDKKKTQAGTNYSESYKIADNVNLIIQSIHKETSSYNVHGTFQYKIENFSHFQIDLEIDLTNSQHIRTQEKNDSKTDQRLFRVHIEPFSSTSPDPKIKDQCVLCEIQYLKGYDIRARIKCALTFPSLDIQRKLIVSEHEEIGIMIAKCKDIPGHKLEQHIFFVKSNEDSGSDDDDSNKDDDDEDDDNHNDDDQGKEKHNDMNDKDSKLREEMIKRKRNKLRSYQFNTSHRDENIYCFIDRSFPPLHKTACQIDLTKMIETKENLSATESDKDKARDVAIHYRAIEDILPEKKVLIAEDELNPYDITFGLYQNQNILSVFVHLSQYPQLLLRLIPNPSINVFGFYKVRLFTMGSWTEHYIDKYIPCFSLSFPLYTYSTNSLWACLIEKALAKYFGGYEALKTVSFFQLYTILTGFPIQNIQMTIPDKQDKYDKSYIINSNLSTFTSMTDKILNDKGVFSSDKYHNNLDRQSSDPLKYVKNNFDAKKKYILCCYASNKFYEKKDSKYKTMFKKNTVYPLIYICENFITIHNLYQQLILPQSFIYKAQHAESEPINDLYGHNWNDLYHIKSQNVSDLFDNIIMIQVDFYHEVNLRGGFIRCYDVQISNYDRILSHSYYNVTIAKDNVQMKIILNLNDRKELEMNYLMQEMDWRFGIFSIHNEKHRYFDTYEFTTGYSLVYENKMPKGKYMILPMTTGYSMQKNPNIKSKAYQLTNDKKAPIDLNSTIVSSFIDDLFYINDPFCKGYLPYRVVKDIVENMIKGRDDQLTERYFNSLCDVCDVIKSKRGDEKGMTLGVFRHFIIEKLKDLDNDELKRKAMNNVGYDYSGYAYLGRFFAISFYFLGDDLSPEDIIIEPQNNLIEENMDSKVNIQLLNMKNKEKIEDSLCRVYYENMNKWYTVEGIACGKIKGPVPEYRFSSSFAKERYYSTYQNNMRIIVPENTKNFLMYTVEKDIEIPEKDKKDDKDIKKA